MSSVRSALVLETSGTEGVPKRVQLSEQTLRASARMGQAIEALRPGDCWLNCLSLSHVAGAAIGYRCEEADATMLRHQRFDPVAVDREIVDSSVTHLSLVPVMLSKLLEQFQHRQAPDSLRTVLIGGDRLPKPLALRAVDQGWPLVVSYGMTETASRIAMLRLTPENIEAWEESDVGPPLPGVDVSIDEAGAICIRSEQLFPGEAREIRTRDHGSIDQQGHLHVYGRLDHKILSGGFLIDPVEVEQQLLQSPAIEDAGVTSIEDPEWGERVVAFIQRSGAVAEVEQWVQQLPGHLRPRHWFERESIGRNRMGKINRTELRERAITAIDKV